MSLLVETIRCENGKLLNISIHNERMIRSLLALYGFAAKVDLEKLIVIPDSAGIGIFKCRVVYDRSIRSIEFQPYSFKPVNSLRLVEDNTVEYPFKYTDRTHLEKLSLKKGDADDILIIKEGMVTDSSFANVVFRKRNGNWVTPSTYLLNGVRRTSLLFSGSITEEIITCSDLKEYSEVKLINAMRGIDDSDGIPIANIL